MDGLKFRVYRIVHFHGTYEISRSFPEGCNACPAGGIVMIFDITRSNDVQRNEILSGYAHGTAAIIYYNMICASVIIRHRTTV